MVVGSRLLWVLEPESFNGECMDPLGHRLFAKLCTKAARLGPSDFRGLCFEAEWGSLGMPALWCVELLRVPYQEL